MPDVLSRRGLYGGYNLNGSKIGADPDIPAELGLKMGGASVRWYLNNAPHRRPHLDIGSGIEFSRRFMPGAVSVDNDLDVDRFRFADDTFNTVTSFEVLEHLYNPLFHLMEVRRVMKGGGLLYLTTPNDWSLIHRAEHLLGRKYAPHFHQFIEFDLRQIMARAGFEIVSLEKSKRGGSGTISRLSKNLFLLMARKP